MPLMADEGKEPWDIPDPDFNYRNEDFTSDRSLSSVRFLKTNFYNRIKKDLVWEIELGYWNTLNQIEGYLLKVAAEKAGKGSKEEKEYLDYVKKTKRMD